jgi:hypothetical protein
MFLSVPCYIHLAITFYLISLVARCCHQVKINRLVVRCLRKCVHMYIREREHLVDIPAVEPFKTYSFVFLLWV